MIYMIYIYIYIYDIYIHIYIYDIYIHIYIYDIYIHIYIYDIYIHIYIYDILTYIPLLCWTPKVVCLILLPSLFFCSTNPLIGMPTAGRGLPFIALGILFHLTPN